MAFVPAICINCGAQIQVDNTLHRGKCEYCGTEYVTEHAINDYAFKNTAMENVQIGGVVVEKEIGNRIIKLINEKKTVQAIKELREASGLGLKEAKDAVDLYSGNICESQATIEGKKKGLFGFLRK